MLEGDIKGCFDNISHEWILNNIPLDKEILRKWLKCGYIETGKLFPTKQGSPQGSAISPVICNMVLDGLEAKLKAKYHKTKIKGKAYFPKVNFIRYADDFKIFCRNRKDADRTYHAVEDWLLKRLKLETSDEKSKVTNLRKRDSEFLGFRMKLIKKRRTWVISSNVCDKAMSHMQKELSKAIIEIQNSKTASDIKSNIHEYNAKVIGMQNYYCIATRINLNFSRMAHVNNGRFLHRIDGYKKQGELNNKYLKKRYGKSKQMRWIGDTPVVPLAYVQFKIPMRKSRKINLYTLDGRMEIHSNLKLNVEDMLWLMRHPVTGETVQFNDNRISLYAGQEGKCAITGEQLEVIHCICYRKSNECKKWQRQLP